MGDKAISENANQSSSSESTWSNIASAIYSFPQETVMQGLQGIKDGAGALSRAATAAGASVENGIESQLKQTPRVAPEAIGIVVGAVAGQAAGHAVKAGIEKAGDVVIDKVGDAADVATRIGLGGPQAKAAELAAEGAMSVLAGGVGGAAMKAGARAAKAGMMPPMRDAMLDKDLPKESKLPEMMQKAGQRLLSEVMDLPSDVYSHLRNNPVRAGAAALVGGLPGLIIDTKLTKD